MGTWGGKAWAKLGAKVGPKLIERTFDFASKSASLAGKGLGCCASCHRISNCVCAFSSKQRERALAAKVFPTGPRGLDHLTVERYPKSTNGCGEELKGHECPARHTIQLQDSGHLKVQREKAACSRRNLG